MTVEYTPPTFSGGIPSATKLNKAFKDVEEALKNALNKNEVSDNEMETDLDMNSNDIINVGSEGGTLLATGDLDPLRVSILNLNLQLSDVQQSLLALAEDVSEEEPDPEVGVTLEEMNAAIANGLNIVRQERGVLLDQLNPQRRISPVDGWTIADSPVTTPAADEGDWGFAKDEIVIDGVVWPAGTVISAIRDTIGGTPADWAKDEALTKLVAAETIKSSHANMLANSIVGDLWFCTDEDDNQGFWYHSSGTEGLHQFGGGGGTSTTTTVEGTAGALKPLGGRDPGPLPNANEGEYIIANSNGAYPFNGVNYLAATDQALRRTTTGWVVDESLSINRQTAVYVDDHGAVGNYVSQRDSSLPIVDCTAAFNAAIAEALVRKLPVKFSHQLGGDYYVRDLAAIPNELQAQLRIKGNGSRNTVIWHRADDGALITAGTGAEGVSGSSTNSEQDWDGLHIEGVGITAVKEGTEIDETSRKVEDGVCIGMAWRFSNCTLRDVHIEGYYKAIAGLSENTKSWALHVDNCTFAHNYISIESTEHALTMNSSSIYFGETGLVIRGSSSGTSLTSCDISAHNDYAVKFIPDSLGNGCSSFSWNGGYCEGGYDYTATNRPRSINGDLKTTITPSGVAKIESSVLSCSFHNIHMSLQQALWAFYIDPNNAVVDTFSIKDNTIRRDTLASETARIVQFNGGNTNSVNFVFEDNRVGNGEWSNVTNDTNNFVKLDYQGTQLVPYPGALGLKDSVQTADIESRAVTLSKLEEITTGRLLGNVSGSAGPVVPLNPEQVRTMLNVGDGETNGVIEWTIGNQAEVVYVTLTAETPNERVLMSLKSNGDSTVSPDSATGKDNWDYGMGMVLSNFSPNLSTRGYYKVDHTVLYEITPGVWKRYRCKVDETTASPTASTDANWSLDEAVATLPATTGRTTVAADTATNADFDNIIILADTHTPTLFAETDSAYQWKTITFFSEGATELTFQAGGTTMLGNTKINQYETVTATCVAVGATTGTVWYLTGGST